MDTPIYGVIQQDVNKFTALLFLHLDQLTDRMYRGQIYRGASIVHDDIDAYK